MNPSCQWIYNHQGRRYKACFLETGDTFEHFLRFKFKIANNETKYKALLMKLYIISKDILMMNLKIYNDSPLVVNQVEGVRIIKAPKVGEGGGVVGISIFEIKL